MINSQDNPTRQELKRALQLMIAETIKLLQEGQIQKALMLLAHADTILEEKGYILSENNQTFFRVNVGRFHDAARYLNNSKMIAPLLSTTKNELLESEESSDSENGKEEVNDSNNNNAPKKTCQIL